MNSLKTNLGALLVAGVCLATFSAKAGWFCPTPVYSTYENRTPDYNLMQESILTEAKEASLKQKEVKYTNSLGKRQGDGLRPVRGLKSKHSEVITEMQTGAKNGASIIGNSKTEIANVSDLGNYSSAKSQINKELTIRPYAERNGKEYTSAEIQTVLENQRTVVNDFSANAIGMGAAETVNAAGSAAESDPETRAKEVAKAETLAELYELMLGMDRKIYERSLHASAVEATNAGVVAIQLLTGASTTSGGQ